MITARVLLIDEHAMFRSGLRMVLNASMRGIHQLRNPERDRHKGLGLGLAIADGLAALRGMLVISVHPRSVAAYFVYPYPSPLLPYWSDKLSWHRAKYDCLRCVYW